MIDLKRFNYFSGEESAVAKAVSQICQLLELSGRNFTLLHHYYSNKLGMQHQMQPAQPYKTESELLSMLDEPSTLFRVDLLVLDAWNMKSESLERVVSKISSLKLDCIIMAQTYRIVVGNEAVSEYSVHSNLIEGKRNTKLGMPWPVNEIRIKCKTDNWSATTEELKAAYIRDKRLDDLLGE